jgi:hypothetical protein
VGFPRLRTLRVRKVLRKGLEHSRTRAQAAVSVGRRAVTSVPGRGPRWNPALQPGNDEPVPYWMAGPWALWHVPGRGSSAS